MEYEAEARKADREFSGAEYVRDTGGGLSRSAKQFVSDCAEKVSIIPERLRCCHGQNEARVMISNFINRSFGGVSVRGVARVRHAALTAATDSKQY